MPEQEEKTEQEAEKKPLSYPRTTELYLTLEIKIPSSEQDEYLFAEAGRNEVLQIGFLADLFDLLNNDANLGVLRINGSTYEQIKKTLAGSYNQ